MARLLLLICVPGLVVKADPPLQIGAAVPELLDLRDAQVELLVPKDSRDPSQVEAARVAWTPVIHKVQGRPSVRLRLPGGDDRVPLLLAACQALKADHPARKVYIAFEPAGSIVLDELAWGAVEGGALTPEDLGANPAKWRDVLAQAQEQFPGRPWTLWLPGEPGAGAAVLLGDGARLVVPPEGSSAQLAAQLPQDFVDLEGGMGDLTLRNRRSGEARRWLFREGRWQAAPLPEERHEVSVVAREAYDVGALLAKMRATQLRERAAVRTLSATVDYALRFQGERGSQDLGFTFHYFDKLGEGEELLRTQVRWNGVSAKLHGEVQLPVVEARTSVAAPVALTLNERYRYSDGGPGGPGQRILRFHRVDKDPLLYEGEVTVEESTGRMLEERSSREGLPGMVRSEHRVLTYGEPLPGLWRIQKSVTSERWITSGGVSQVMRTITYRDIHVNEPDFESLRQAARASNGSMLKQTPDGFRYFVRQGDGTRRVEPRMRNRSRGVAGILLMDPNADMKVMPLAGLAFVDFDAFNRGVQYTFVTAAVFNMLSLTVPQIGGGFDFKARTVLTALKGTERPVRNGELLDGEGVGRRRQSLELGLGRDVGYGVRLDLSGRFQHDIFTDPKESKYQTQGFLNPPSGLTKLAQAEVSWLRKGFMLQASHVRGKRPAGPYGAPGRLVRTPDEGRLTYTHGALSYDHEFRKDVWLKGTLGTAWGSGFDRFEALDFGGMVSGIRPHAVVADRMAYGMVRLAIPTGPKLRLNLGLDHGRARSIDDHRTYGFTGMTIAGDLPGFWVFTSMRVDLGVGLHSDVKGVKSVNGMITVLRLF